MSADEFFIPGRVIRVGSPCGMGSGRNLRVGETLMVLTRKHKQPSKYINKFFTVDTMMGSGEITRLEFYEGSGFDVQPWIWLERA